MSEIGLGRRLSKDPRDLQYKISNNSAVAKLYQSRYWRSPGALDQGGTSQCVAYAGSKYLISAPIYNVSPKPIDIYRECLKVDEWPGEDMNNGTSVRALFKVLKRRGFVSEYRWAFNVPTIVNHVLTHGPVVMGTIWTIDMFMPLKGSNYIVPTGEDAGGHAWLIIGADKQKRNYDGTTGAVRMVNSWGPRWGDKGRAWVTFRDLNKLMRQDGEACVASEILHPAG